MYKFSISVQTQNVVVPATVVGDRVDNYKFTIQVATHNKMIKTDVVTPEG